MSNTIKTFWNASMTNKLLLVNAVVFVLIRFVTGVTGGNSLLGTNSLYLATSADLSVLIMRPWSVITHMFAHDQLWHFLINMMWLYFVGQMFERQFGTRKTLSTYLVGGIAGFLAYFILGNLIGLGGQAVGASAAISGIFIAYATYNPNQKVNLVFLGPVRIMYIAIFFLVMDFLKLGGHNTGGHIGHLGGAAYGFLMATQLKKGVDLNKWMEKLLDKLTTMFKPGDRFTVIKNDAASGRGKTDEQYNYEKKQKSKRMDQILDKIGRGGYDSLTKDEKEFLFRHGKDI